MKSFWAILRQPAARIVVAAALSFVIISWIAVIWQIREDAATAIQSASRENRSRVVAFEQYVRRTLELADLATEYLGERYGGRIDQGDSTRPNLITLPSYFRPMITGAEIADRDGNIRFTTKPTGPINVKDKRVFRELLAAPGIARAISNPSEALNSKGAVLLIARSWRDAKGAFAGAVAVDIPTDRFVDFNAGLRYRPDDLISIISLRGMTLARREGETVSWGQDLKGKEVMRQQMAHPDGEYWGPSAIDGKRRLFSHQRLASYPIFVTSGIGEHDILGPAQQRARWFLVLVSALTLVVGALLALYFRHVLKQQQARRRFDVIRDEFAHSARVSSLSEMAGGLAHELNQPLAAASNFLSVGELMLKGDGSREAALLQVRQARSQITRAGDIIRRIRDYLAKGSADLRIEAIDDVINDAIELARGAKVAPSARITYSSAQPAARALIDRVQIQQVLVNLIRNAEEAMASLPPEQRAIRISCAVASDEFLRICVEDTGPGIPDAVFGKFNMPFISTKADKGLGIGLSICRSIIEVHGGEFKAENLTRGAMICFTVPRDPTLMAVA
ncbi:MULTISPECIES: ATP-binding protein [unclassified Sphingomonas]|uniref:ATP-binding protein n=1 Tax=unclassified Sphingomonas TaxID=196159 RepID=UPI0022B3CE83|nr:ATP-binding protein [Sphingomonas sp. NIBR02145]WHU02818.1 ATP-binding protein [Sphingomonas sp. NIBR02145]